MTWCIIFTEGNKVIDTTAWKLYSVHDDTTGSFYYVDDAGDERDYKFTLFGHIAIPLCLDWQCKYSFVMTFPCSTSGSQWGRCIELTAIKLLMIPVGSGIQLIQYLQLASSRYRYEGSHTCSQQTKIAIPSPHGIHSLESLSCEVWVCTLW